MTPNFSLLKEVKSPIIGRKLRELSACLVLEKLTYTLKGTHWKENHPRFATPFLAFLKNCEIEEALVTWKLYVPGRCCLRSSCTFLYGHSVFSFQFYFIFICLFTYFTVGCEVGLFYGIMVWSFVFAVSVLKYILLHFCELLKNNKSHVYKKELQ